MASQKETGRLRFIMRYIEEFHGREKGNADFIRGMKAGLVMFAWWKDGRQYVGSCGTTLKEALAEVDSVLGEQENPGGA